MLLIHKFQIRLFSQHESKRDASDQSFVLASARQDCMDGQLATAMYKTIHFSLILKFERKVVFFKYWLTIVMQAIKLGLEQFF